MDNTEELTLADVESLLEKHYFLNEVSYDSDLSSDMAAVQKAIREQNWMPLDEVIEDWGGQGYAENDALNTLKDEICRTYGVEDDEAEKFIRENDDHLLTLIRERDESTPLDDLMRHTSDPTFFFDTDEEIPYGAAFSDRDFKEAAHDLKKILRIKQKDTRWDKDIEEVLINASYGGMVEIYFRASIADMMKLGDANKVTFTNPMVAIVDHGNGSGHNVEFEGLTVTFDFHPKQLHIDSRQTVHYAYGDDVCGMISSWAECTHVEFFHRNVRTAKPEPPDSALDAHMELERRYEEVFRAGGCTSGDMNMRRHRNTFYLNEFPCGTHCPHCHTFWID